MKTNLLIAASLLFATAGGLSAAPDVSSTNAPAPAAPAIAATTDTAPAAAVNQNGSRPSLDAFQLLTRRNIFDPSRVKYTPGVVVHIPVVETFWNAGWGQYVGTGYQCDFSNGAFDRWCSVGASIYGMKIVSIDETNGVTLVETNGTNVINHVLPVNVGLTRTDGGPWKDMFNTPTYPAVSRALPLASTGGQGGSSYGGGQSYPVQTAGSYDTSASADNTYNQGGGRNRRNRGGNNFGGGNFGGGVFNLNAQPDTTTAPAAAPDPAVLARLRARRAQD